MPASIEEHIKTLKKRLEVAKAFSQQIDEHTKAKRKEAFDKMAHAKPFNIGTRCYLDYQELENGKDPVAMPIHYIGCPTGHNLRNCMFKEDSAPKCT